MGTSLELLIRQENLRRTMDGIRKRPLGQQKRNSRVKSVEYAPKSPQKASRTRRHLQNAWNRSSYQPSNNTLVRKRVNQMIRFGTFVAIQVVAIIAIKKVILFSHTVPRRDQVQSLIFPDSVSVNSIPLESRVPFDYPDPLALDKQEMAGYPDFGGLSLRFFAYDPHQTPSRRTIYVNELDTAGYDDLELYDPNTQQFYDEAWTDDVSYDNAFDDDRKRDPMHSYDDDKSAMSLSPAQCRRLPFHDTLNGNCNSMHEIDIRSQFLYGGTSLLGSGAFREAYVSPLLDDGKQAIFKAYAWDADWERSDVEYMRMDALVLELMTSSPRIVDIYGYCGSSMVNEFASGGTVEDVALEEYFEEYTDDLIARKGNGTLTESLNHLEIESKLQLALEMAEALSELHSYREGVIVHDDISLSQFLLVDGRVKLNDFNRAAIMLWNDVESEFCRYKNGVGPGWWRSPEEYRDDPLNEKIDIWSLGNSFYAILTGLAPFFEFQDTLDPVDFILNGELPWIDESYSVRSDAERLFVDLIRRCWTVDADERPAISQVIERLNVALAKA